MLIGVIKPKLQMSIKGVTKAPMAGVSEMSGYCCVKFPHLNRAQSWWRARATGMPGQRRLLSMFLPATGSRVVGTRRTRLVIRVLVGPGTKIHMMVAMMDVLLTGG